MEAVKAILKWWHNQRCPRCGGKVRVDGHYVEYRVWRGESEDKPFVFCPYCNFKSYFTNDYLTDEVYLHEIEKVCEGGGV